MARLTGQKGDVVSEAQERVDRALSMVRDSLTAYINAQLAARMERIRVPPNIAFLSGALWGAFAQAEWPTELADDDSDDSDDDVIPRQSG